MARIRRYSYYCSCGFFRGGNAGVKWHGELVQLEFPLEVIVVTLCGCAFPPLRTLKDSYSLVL